MRAAVNNKGNVSFMALAMLAVLFIAGTLWLFSMRFEEGDIHPVYSSLRSDPLGTKILYESLSELSDLRTNRNYRPPEKLLEQTPATILFIGVHVPLPGQTEKKELQILEQMAAEGSRVVITLYPDEGLSLKQDILLTERWGFDLLSDNNLMKDKNAVRISSTDVSASGPESIAWHSPFYFDIKDGRWSSIYELQDKPVVVEKNLGRGSIVISADSYLLSNEAMRNKRNTGFLLWLLGRNKNIIFDETHLGISENPGVSFLIRKYRLHGLFAGLIIAGILFIWKNAISLVPAKYIDNGISGTSDIQRGKGHLSGLAGLLRKNISEKEILAVCADEWKKTYHAKKSNDGEKAGFIESITRKDVKSKQGNPVKTYREICRLLKERKHI